MGKLFSDIPIFLQMDALESKWTAVIERPAQMPFRLMKNSISVTMHLLRSDGKSCCLIESIFENKVELEDDEIWFMPNALIEVQLIDYTQMLYNKAAERFVDSTSLHGVIFNATSDFNDHEIQVDAHLQQGDNEVMDWDGSKVSFAHIMEYFYGWEIRYE